MDVFAQNAYQLEISKLKTNYEREQEVIAFLRKKQRNSLAYQNQVQRLEYVYRSIHDDETLTKEEKRAAWGACKSNVPETLTFVVESSQEDHTSPAGMYLDLVQNIVVPLLITTNFFYKTAFHFYPSIFTYILSFVISISAAYFICGSNPNFSFATPIKLILITQILTFDFGILSTITLLWILLYYSFHYFRNLILIIVFKHYNSIILPLKLIVLTNMTYLMFFYNSRGFASYLYSLILASLTEYFVPNPFLNFFTLIGYFFGAVFSVVCGWRTVTLYDVIFLFKTMLQIVLGFVKMLSIIYFTFFCFDCSAISYITLFLFILGCGVVCLYLLICGDKRLCYVCFKYPDAKDHCEHCLRNHLKSNFTNWNSGNEKVNKLIQISQIDAFFVTKIVEWIPYEQLEYFEYKTKGGLKPVHTATWTNGPPIHYYNCEFVSEYNQSTSQYAVDIKVGLKRDERVHVVLKTLEGSHDQTNDYWIHMIKTHFESSKKFSMVANYHGLTRNPYTGDFMMVMQYMNDDLKNYIRKNHSETTWKQKYFILREIASSLHQIHEDNVVHKNLHPGNILYDKQAEHWLISDIGIFKPLDVLSSKVYGVLSYIAPEVLSKMLYSKKSDIYSFGMLMYEISTGQIPFNYWENDMESLKSQILDGIRPAILPGTPESYAMLMKRCWDADPNQRPDAETIRNEILMILQPFYTGKMSMEDSKVMKSTVKCKFSTNGSSDLQHSQLHDTMDKVTPRNFTIEEQNAHDHKLMSRVIYEE